MARQPLVKGNTAHLRLIVGLVLSDQLEKNGITSEQLGITLGDISKLGDLLTPGVNYWWSRYLVVWRTEFVPALNKQYPALEKLDIEGVTKDNFDTWLRRQGRKLGGMYLAIEPIKKSRKAKA